MAQAFNQFIMS